MNPSDASFKETISSLRHCQDPGEFNNTVNNAKSKLLELMKRNQFDLLESFSRTLLLTLDCVKDKDDAFILSVLESFPVNSKVTFSLLGENNVINELILSDKLSLGDISATEEKDYMPLVRWAVSQDRQDVLQRVIKQLSEDLDANYKNSLKTKQTTFSHLVHALIWGDEDDTIRYSKEIDALMSGLADILDPAILDVETLHSLVRSDLHLTLMKLIERERFRRYDGNCHTPSESLSFYDALPDNPTMNELVHLFLYTDMPGVCEKVLFDKNYPVEDFVKIMNPEGAGLRSKLTLDNLEHLSDFTNKEYINSAEKRRRVDFLFNSVCSHLVSATHGSYGSAADVMEDLRDRWFDPYLFKVCKCFRVQHLEDELGM